MENENENEIETKTVIEKILDFIKNEPVAFGGFVMSLFQAVIGLLIAFNVNLTQAQQASIFALVGVMVTFTILMSTIIRGEVTPVSNPRDNSNRKLVPLNE